MIGAATRLVALTLTAIVAQPALARDRTVTGVLEVVQIDDFDHGASRVIHHLRDERTGRRYELEISPDDVSAGRRLRTGTRVAVRGRVRRGVRRDGARVLVAPPGGALSLTVIGEAVAAEVATTGARRALVLLVDFSQDGKTVGCSDSAVGASMFAATGSVDALYREASFGATSWNPDTDGNGAPDVLRVRIDDGGGDCDATTWRKKADAAATAAGARLSLYQHRLYVLPSSVACGWAGMAQLACGSNCWAMVATCNRGDVYAHELGHNLGMYHASYDADANGAVDPTCPWGYPQGGEYCDDSDVMGISTGVWRQMNGPHKVQMGWVPSAKMVDVTTSGTYALAPLATAPEATELPLVLRVARPAGGPLYISYRRRIGSDAALRASYADRTSIHTRPVGNSLLLGVLGDGQHFTDPVTGVVVSQVDHTAAHAEVRITMPCDDGDCATCSDADGDGVCATDGDCDDADPSVHPGAAEVCAGGADEDCNGLRDCTDAACTSAPGCGVCIARGDACRSNADCCSRKCRGKPKRRTCR